MKNIKKISVLSFCLALLLAGCMTNKEYFQQIGIKEDGTFTAECVFAKNGKNPKTKADEVRYVTEKCSLNMEKIRNLASYCATKSHSTNKEFEDLMYKNRNSLNKNKLAANFKVNYDTEYKRLRDIALGDNIEVISSIDLSQINEDAARDYLLDNVDITKVDPFSLKSVPELLKNCDIVLLKKKSPYHQEKQFVDIWE
jgi:hypothetical protein